MKQDSLNSEILIIGTGIAGLTSAIYAAQSGFQVNLITKAKHIEDNSTWLAQGGIVYQEKEKDIDSLIRDILTAGDGLSLKESVQVLAKEGTKYINDLLIGKAGIEFTRCEDGSLDFTAEAAHSDRRIIHSTDATGKAIEKGLLKLVKKYKNVKIFRQHIALDFITPHHIKDQLAVYKDPEVYGCFVLDLTKTRVKKFYSKVTILATGGLGQVYKYTTNHPLSTGDGFAMAKRAKASIINMEYTQFHPTALYSQSRPLFLITEALRGEGAVLKTIDGKEFMKKYHSLASLAPRDVVAKSIHKEMLKNNQPYVLLDIGSYMEGDKIKKRFPTIYQTCRDRGIDITSRPIPVVPAFHFICGGIKVDLWGRTSLKRLFAVGEVSCTGAHGANRLASTSLLESLIWGAKSIEFINKNKHFFKFKIKEAIDWTTLKKEESDPAVLNKAWHALKDIMWNYVGLVRNTRRLQMALEELQDLSEMIEKIYISSRPDQNIIELRNGIQSALLVAQAAWENKKSRGTHYRVD
ncbi:MAG: L-aspartate oxidase [Spirochaetes bacterium]|nr:L-aspartate oxidase [Spirochaetota bacterium]